MDKKSQEKYLICPVCFSIYSLDKPQEDYIMLCEHCEDVEIVPLEEFLYYSSVESLKELKDNFIRSKHLDEDSKEFIVDNIKILIQILKECADEKSC